MLIPIILSGGIGSRLWPISREMRPKQFIKMLDGQSLLQKAFQRAANLDSTTEILTVTKRDFYFETKDEYQALNLSNTNISFLLEPFGRNTAPAIALAAFNLLEKYGEAVTMLILTADHLIRNQDAFAEAVSTAFISAKQGNLVTFGINPTSAETGYGYIEYNPQDKMPITKVVRFVEKPTVDVAEHYLDTGNYLWNSGMFCFTAKVILEQIKMHTPQLFASALECWEVSKIKNSDVATIIEIDSDTFRYQPDISLDYAIMEKAENVLVIPCDMGWSDIGSWDAFSALSEPDAEGNRIQGEALLLDVQNSYFCSEERIIAAIGVNNLIVVDTPDALLITDKNRSQDVKQIVEQLRGLGHESYRLHQTIHRPWGTYTLLEKGDYFKIKRIVVKPGASLSLQIHYHRSEHWVVVSGMAKVINGEKKLLINTNESTFIPAGHLHRLENPGLIDLVLIEIQSGEYLSEDDIVRIEDKYGRVNKRELNNS
ncbi:mannose-1-phosphate guanylyltransferase/mannose-6-phosphate isomerase [soil metagenome]